MAVPYDFTLAGRWKPVQRSVGEERNPVLMIDDVMEKPAELVRFASEQGGFTEDMAGLYPGTRAPLPLDYARDLIGRLDPLIRSAYDLPAVKLAKADCVYSLVTLAPDRLHPFQQIPHIDTTSELHFAALHYLCSDSFGGTAFFRQRATGYECITHEREAAYEAARDRDLKQPTRRWKSALHRRQRFPLRLRRKVGRRVRPPDRLSQQCAA